MDRSTVIYLVSEAMSQSDIGEWVSTETLRKVYANVSDISASEYFNASQIGLNPEIRFTMFAPDYNGELKIEYNGVRWSVYRIYRTSSERLELYVQREAGTASVTTTTATVTVTTTTATATESEDEHQG